MKPNLLNSNKTLLLLLFFVLLIGLLSCKSKKEIIHSVENKVVTKQDTIYIEKTSVINDTIFITEPIIKTSNEEYDHQCQEALKKALKNIQTHKKTTHSQYGLYYDDVAKRLIIYQNLNPQYSVYRSKNQDVKSESSKTITIEKPVPYIPLWIKIIA